MKAKSKAHHRKRVVRAKVRTPQPVQQAPVETVQAPPPPEPMLAPAPEPAPQVVEAPPAPTPAPAAPLAVAKKGGSGWLLGVLAAAAVVAGVVVASDGGKPKSA